ncbi:MAG: ATP-binding cassette domain-containing protein [Thioalkalispiraceae bacterium]|jgi:ATP-binding cassette subfamily F protein uup
MLLNLSKVSLAYGHLPLLKDVDFQIEKGERVCLVGRNGTGKSTMFKVISGMVEPDEGEIWKQPNLRISYLEQEVPEDKASTIYDVVASGLGNLGQLLTEYHHILQNFDDQDPDAMRIMSELQHKIELQDGWNSDQKIETVLSKLSLPTDKLLKDCSGGIRRRVMLARALVSDPELLLLDEPTNHMDIAAIKWLEEFLMNFQGALIFITHDRTFVRNLATRIIELDRGTLTTFPGNYETYLAKKQELLAIEERAAAKFDKKLAQEEAWIRQGVKARRTRNQGRVRALKDMRDKVRQRIRLQGKADLELNRADIAGKLVADLYHVNFSYGDQPIIQDLSTRILRGDRVGIIGPNGSGKSTLLKIILGELKPDSGKIVLGTKLDKAYFDQHRAILDPEKSVRDNLSENSDYIEVKGRSRHVIGYLRSFLFPPERVDSPVKSLSGGERNRLLLAKLFTKPCNLMILDEPTNDLDVDTLELLEDLLTEFDGTLLLVSHDRTFLDNIVTSTLVFEDDGHVSEYVGGYEDWLRQRPEPGSKAKEIKKDKEVDVSAIKPVKARKLSYKESRELAELPQLIEALEEEKGVLEARVSDSAFYQQEKDQITETLERLEYLNIELEQAYERWEDLAQYE